MQKHRVNKLALSDFHKRTLKRATTWYAWEKDKPGGLLSYPILQKVKKEYDGIALEMENETNGGDYNKKAT